MPSSEQHVDEWWVTREGRRYGPLTRARLETLYRAGKVLPGDLVGRRGELPLAAAKMLGHAVDPPMPPPAPVPPPAPSQFIPVSSVARHAQAASAAEQAKSLSGDAETLRKYIYSNSSLVKLFITRILQSDFGVIQPTEDEKQRLEASAVPLTDELAQRYAAWRRSVLAIAFLLLACNAVLGIGSIEFGSGPWSWLWFGSVSLGLFGVQVLGALLAGLAALRWDNIHASRRWARASWMALFLLPIVIFAIPIAKLAGMDHGVLPSLTDLKFAAERAAVLFPKLLGLFPGVMRACMTLKTLVPESSAPGWSAILIAPVYSIFFFVCVAITVQVTQSPALIGGLVLLGVAPLTYIRRAREVIRSHNEVEGRQLVRSLRRTFGICTAVGIGLITLQLFRWVDLGQISWRTLLNAMTGLFGSLLLFTVVGSDVILALLWRLFEESRAFEGSVRQQQLAEKFEALSRVGLTELEAGETELLRRVMGRGCLAHDPERDSSATFE